jgi:hypothetical protein
MNKIVGFGENVDGYEIPVLNEREIRAAAGMLFFATFLSLLFILFRQYFLPIRFVITFFLLDFLIRVLVNPRFSPTLILGRLIVRNQVPEYVAAQPKKVAWIIGVGLSATMFVLMTILNTYSPITGIICLICLIFLFFESAFGICLGCKFYALVYRKRARYCPGEVCEARSRQDIQKTSAAQLLALCGFVAFIVLSVFVLHGPLAEPAHPLFGREKPPAATAGASQHPASDSAR